MSMFLKKAAMGTALAATALAAAAPADAQRWGGYRHHRGGDAAGAAIVGGILGLGIGAAIASSSNRNRYYDRGGYYDGGYYDRGYYDRGYYAQPYYEEYRPRCWRQWRWDPYYGQQVPVRVCR